MAFQRLVRRVPVADEVVRYAVGLARRSRPKAEGSPEFVRKWVEYGASVRAAQYLVLGGKARALMHGRSHVSFDDIRALAHPVFRHRILRNFHAESERVDTGQIVDQLLEAVPVAPLADVRPMPAATGARFLDPLVLARIDNLELLARTVVEGFINGLHRSPYLGHSVDFAEHRPYMPGDDIRRIDWRLYARTDRYYVKEFEADSNANFLVLLDRVALDAVLVPRDLEARLRSLPCGLPHALRPQAEGSRGARDLRRGRGRLHPALGETSRGRSPRARPAGGRRPGRARAASAEDRRCEPAAGDLRPHLRSLRGPGRRARARCNSWLGGAAT